MRRLTDFLTGRRTSWIVLAVSLLAAALLYLAGGGAKSEAAPSLGLPTGAESVRAETLQKSLPSAGATSMLIAYSRGGGAITGEDVLAINAAGNTLLPLALGGHVPPASVSADGKAALLYVPLAALDNVAQQASRADQIRTIANTGLPQGLTGLLTGPEGFAVDLSAVFAGANLTLLITTVIVVALLLIITYRSPWLWIVPLAVITMADAIAGIAAARVASAFGILLDPSVTGILSVLVFGAGTNYALLLIARYRDELRLVDDKRHAMSRALRGAGPAVLASGTTVALSLLTLLFAQLTGNQALGLACAIGIIVAMFFALIVLPTLLLLFGRGIFWPFVPKFASEDKAAQGIWFRLGTGVSKRPVIVIVIGAIVLGGLAIGATQIQLGISQTDRFVSAPESVRGQKIIAASFAAGSGSPTVVIVNAAEAEAAATLAASVPGVSSANVVESDGTITRIDVVLSAASGTSGSTQAIADLRTQLHALPGANALVGGRDAESLDVNAASRADQTLVIPLVLAVVFVVLILLLRALLAPVLLLLTVIASYFASLGASWLLFTNVFHFPAIDTSVILLSFLFLVALGVDYNIFLTTRADEEARELGTKPGMISALAATGGVITSAGILLAAVFAVLGVLPLITLTQIGVIVCVGVLLDTLLVRTVLVPSLAFITGDRFWWPRRLRPTLSHAEPYALD